MRKLRLNVFRLDAATVAARAQGLFAKEGLEVESIVTLNSTEQMRGLSQGRFDIVSTAFDNVLAWSGREGAEIVAIAQISDKTVLPVFVRPEIKTWSDLKGKKLAADAVDTAFALVLRRVLLANGLDMTKGDYELLALGTTGARLESMIKGETFAGVLNSPFDGKALEAGMRRMGDSRTVLPDYPNTIFVVARQWAQQNRNTVDGFLHGRIGVLDAERCAVDAEVPQHAQVIGSRATRVDLDAEFRIGRKTEAAVDRRTQALQYHGVKKRGGCLRRSAAGRRGGRG